MKKQFNLKKRRLELFKYFREQFNSQNIASDILGMIEKQDEEFIKELKCMLGSICCEDDYYMFCKEIDKLVRGKNGE